MKVCIIYYSYFNPLLIRDSSAHVSRGDEVHVICYTLGNEIPRLLDDKLSTYRVMKRDYGENCPLKYLFKIMYFFFLTFIKVSVLHLRKRFDLIHVVSPPDFMVFTAIIPRLLGAKLILNIHDIVPEFYMRKFGVKEEHIVIKILKSIEKICCRFSDHVFTVTDIWRDKLIARTGISDSKCSVIMNVPDDRLVKLAREKEIAPNSHFRLLYPGNLGEHFGVETLIRAMPLLEKEIPLIKLDIYGDGPQKEHLQDLAGALHVEEKISFNRFIPIEELFVIMRRVDIGIVPTLDGVFAGEALSTKSLEFLAIGTPVVISRTKVSEYYYDDSMVMFFKQGDHYDLARCVIELYKNHDRRKVLVQNAEQFNKRHNWEHYKRAYLGTADSLVG